MNLRAILLSPFALIHALVLRLRHALFDGGFLPSRAVDLNMIRVGNLAFGGTGKTPFTEYLLSSLKNEYKMGVVSRGYGRKVNELTEVKIDNRVIEVGDEPLQIKRKFSDIPVYVFHDRYRAIDQLKHDYSHVNMIVLDDALQHRKLKGGLKILLTTADRPFVNDFLFPSGYLRDLRSRASKMDMIVVTKADPQRDYSSLKKRLERYGIPVFFSGLTYDQPTHISTGELLTDDKPKNGLLVSGIANPMHLEGHIKSRVDNLEHLRFKDHHNYTHADLQKILESYHFFHGPSVIFTTEKDAMRLVTHCDFSLIAHLPIYVVKVRMKLLEGEKEFLELIRNYAG